jgi:hypothetical protein
MMISGEARLTRCVSEGERLASDHVHRSLKLDGSDLPESGSIGITVCAESFGALAPDCGESPGIVFMERPVQRPALIEWRQNRRNYWQTIGETAAAPKMKKSPQACNCL